MVQYNRLDPKRGGTDHIRELKKQIGSNDTAPMGDVGIRGTIEAVDPETGVSTIFGVKPDGSTGLQQWINDVTPPGQPSTPSVQPAIAGATVTWDGLIVGGTGQPDDYDRTEIEYSTDGIIWSLGGTLYGTNSHLITDLTVGVVYSFRLKSYDKNNNGSLASEVVTTTPTALIDNPDLDLALTNLRNKDTELTSNVSTATNAANAAQLEADRLWDSVSKSYVNPGTDPTRWTVVQGPAITAVASTGAMTGTALQKSGVGTGWWEDRSGMQPFDPEMLYRVTAKYRVIDAATTYEYLWVGTTNASESILQTDGVETRRNYCKNPNLELNTTGYGSANEATLSHLTTTAMTGTKAGRITFTGTTIVDSGLFFNGSMTTSASTTYTVSMDVLSDTNRSVKFSAQGTGVIAQNSTNISLTAGIKQRISWSFTTSSTAPTAVSLYLLRADLTTGVLDFDSVLIEKGTAVAGYFDGNTADVMGKSMYLGVAGFTANQVTYVNTVGQNTYGSQHYVVSSRISTVAEGWVTVEGYIRGYGTTTGTNGNFPDPKTPATMHPNVKYISPVVILDYASGDGIWELSHITLDAVPPEFIDRAIAAETAANTAQSDATQAINDAGLAMTAAGQRSRIVHLDTTPPVPTDGWKEGDVWYKHTTAVITSPIIDWYIWKNGTWELQTLDETFLPLVNIGTGTYGFLSGNRFEARSIDVTSLIVSDFTNQWQNPDFESDIVGQQAKGITNNPAVLVVSGGDSGSDKALSLPAKSGSTQDVRDTNLISVQPGDVFHLAISAKFSNTAGTGLGIFGFTLYSANKTSQGSQAIISYSTKNTTWERKEGTYTVPAGTYFIQGWVQFSDNTETTNAFQVDNLEIRRKNAGKLIVDGSITAAKVDTNELWANTAWIDKANLRTASFLTNADGTGYTSTVTGQGLKLTYTEPTTGETQERIKLGTFDDDYFAITDDLGETAISIDKTGTISSKSMVTEQFTYKGDELETYLSGYPNGVDTSMFYGGSSIVSNIGTGWLRVIGGSFVAKPGRNYKAVFQGMQAYTSINGGKINLKMCYGSEPPTTSYVPTDSSVTYCPIANEAFTIPPLQAMGTFNQSVDEVVIYITVFIRITTTGTANYRTYPSDVNFAKPLRLWIEDMGPDVPESGTAFLESGTPPVTPATTKTTRTVTWNYNGVRSFTGTNGHYNYNITKGYQGLSPAGAGNLKSIWTFPDVTGAIGSATVHEIWAYFYFEHWYYNAGGTARIGVHGNTNNPLPSTFVSSETPVITSGSWPRAAGRWVKLPSSTYANFKNGTYKGFTLLGDGTVGTYAIANYAKLKIKYTS